MDTERKACRFSFICKSSVLALLLTASSSAFAEYFLVFSSCSSCACPQPVCMQGCASPCVINLNYHSPRRHHYVGAGEEEEYEWYGDP